MRLKTVIGIGTLVLSCGLAACGGDDESSQDAALTTADKPALPAKQKPVTKGADAVKIDRALNTWYTIPSYRGGSGRALLSAMYNPSGPKYVAADGRVEWRGTSSNCLYVQGKFVEPLGKDTSYGRVSGNSCGRAYWTTYHMTSLFNYSRVRFRLCKDQLGPDPCGSESAVIRR